MNVSLSLIIALTMGGLMMLCVGAALALRGNRTLIWLALSLACAGGYGLALKFFDKTPAFIALAMLTLPGGYYCVGRGVRLLLGQSDPMHGIHIGVVLLALTGIGLEMVDDSAGWQSATLYLACVVAASETLFRLLRIRRRKAVDVALLIGIIAVIIPYLIRLPFLIAVPEVATYGGPWIGGQSLGQMVLAAEGLLTTLCVFLLLGKTIGEVISFYRLRSEQDALTGLLNRRSFAERVAAQGTHGALLLCDIDHFKRVNDKFGHPAGDAVIRALAGLLHCTGYPAGRMGGEEFALLLPGFDAMRAERLAEELRACFEALTIEPVTVDHPLSASFGVAVFDETESADMVHGRADEALYVAKESGRNRVVVYRGAPQGTETTGAVYQMPDRQRSA